METSKKNFYLIKSRVVKKIKETRGLSSTIIIINSSINNNNINVNLKNYS